RGDLTGDADDGEPVAPVRGDLQAEDRVFALAVDLFDFEAGHREAVGERLRRCIHGDVLAEPFEGDEHQSCLRTRRSFSKRARMSPMPWLTSAMRSRPRPKARPDHSSGSMPTWRSTLGWIIPAP